MGHSNMEIANVPKYHKIFVLCGAGLVTGGPELLHQLVNELNKNGCNAFISYTPFGVPAETPKPYKKYLCPQGNVEDCERNLVIMPEGLTRYSLRIRKAKVAIWWLSVDNFFRFPQNNLMRNPLCIDDNKAYDFVRYAISAFKNRPIFTMKNIDHYCQSNYALNFLNTKGICGKMLTDYISEEHFKEYSTDTRENLVLFNPKKGVVVTKHLIQSMKEYTFVPLQNMTSTQVAKLMSAAKVYIDFGNHPGKDRAPREAAVHGCCVILGNDGAAGAGDYMINNRYVIDSRSKEFPVKTRSLIDNIFNDYNSHAINFKGWVNSIRNEKKVFQSQVLENFVRSSVS